jgi:hypothetical protein
MARSAVSLPHQRKKKTSGDLEGGWKPLLQTETLRAIFSKCAVVSLCAYGLVMHRVSMQFKSSHVGPGPL